MEVVKGYLLCITAASIVCGLVNSLLGEKGTLAAIGKLLSGLFLTLAVCSPLVKLNLRELADFHWSLETEAVSAAVLGKTLAEEEVAAIIKAQTESYILDKAASLNAELRVAVEVDAGTMRPVRVRISGQAAPYARKQLETAITKELGIPGEEQLWTG